MSQTSMHNEAMILRNEHASLDREITEWRTWWKQLDELGDPNFGQMGDRLERFRDHLQGHFAHEESDAGVALFANLPPELSKQADDLRDEHGKLLQQLNALVDRLHVCDLEHDCWGSARQDFETFLDQLNTHETAEDALLDRIT